MEVTMEVIPKHIYVFLRCREGKSFEDAVREYEEKIGEAKKWLEKYKEYLKKFF